VGGFGKHLNAWESATTTHPSSQHPPLHQPSKDSQHLTAKNFGDITVKFPVDHPLRAKESFIVNVGSVCE